MRAALGLDQDLQLRQERAVRRSAELRQDLGQQSACLIGPLVQAERAKDGLLWLQRHPVYMALIVAIVVALKPRNALSKLGRAWAVWRTVRRFFR